MTDEHADDALLAEFRHVAVAALTPSPVQFPSRLLAVLCGLAESPDPVPAGVPPTVGPYSILRERGCGGMGVVYEGEDPRLARRVAVKVLTAGAYADARARDRFLREARIAAGLRHDHLVPVHAADVTADGVPYLVMPFVDGPTLAERIREPAGLPPRLAAEYARQLADALTAIHAAGVVHRDVKPGNVLIDAADGRAKLTDFGVARSSAPVGTTTADGLPGTPAYLSPEQILQPEAVDGRADVYALGVTLYECLTGVPPFRGPPLELLRLIAGHEPVPPARLNRAVPADLQTICLKCLAKTPAHRYQTAMALRDDLDRFLAGKPVTARPVGSLGQFRRWCRRSPKLAGLSAALALAVVSGTTAAVLLWQQAEASAATARARQQDAELATGREQTQRQLAEANRDAAFGVVDRFCVRVSEEELLRIPGVEPVRRKLLTDAVDHYRKLVAVGREDTRAGRAVAHALSRLSSLLLVLGETEEATAAGREALAAHERLAESDTPADLTALAEDWLQMCRCHAAAHRRPEAVAAGLEAVRRFDTLAQVAPTDTRTRRHAEALLALGSAEQASHGIDTLARFREAIRLLEPLAAAGLDADAKRGLADALSAVATARMTADDIPTLERVRGLRRELLLAAPEVPQRRFDLALVSMNLGVLYKWANRPADALASYSAAADELERLVADAPRVVTWRRQLARTRYNLFKLRAEDGRADRGLGDLRAACDHFERLSTGQPPEPSLNLELNNARAELGWHLVPTDPAAAVTVLQRVTAAVGSLHAVRDLSVVQNDRLTLHVVARAARGWAAVGEHATARNLLDEHAAHLKRCDSERVSAAARQELFRVRAEVARHDGPEALLAAVDQWAEAFPNDGGELADAARACVVGTDPANGTDKRCRRAKELFRKAKVAGWEAPPGWQGDPFLAPFIR